MNQIEIIEYSDQYKAFFKKLNTEWIEKMFVVEPTDEYVLDYPYEAVIENDGMIFFAKIDGEVVGTFALIKVDDSTYELAKMAVTEAYRSRGIGRKLMKMAIQKAKDWNLERLILYSNSQLTTAVNMYIDFGFRMIPKTDFHNNRANIKMELKLNHEILNSTFGLFYEFAI